MRSTFELEKVHLEQQIEKLKEELNLKDEDKVSFYMFYIDIYFFSNWLLKNKIC